MHNHSQPFAEATPISNRQSQSLHMNDQLNLLEGIQASHSRRAFLRRAGLASAVAAVAPAAAALLSGAPNAKAVPATNLDAAVLNFALNLEYVEGEYYCYAATGAGLTSNGAETYGAGNQGTLIIKPDAAVPWSDPLIQQIANEIAEDELTHVNFLRGSLYEAGYPYYAEPNLDLLNSFNALAQAAGIGSAFDPFASDVNFLLGAFIFEDVGVTAYAGAAALLTSPAYLQAASGILAVEAFHASTIRTLLFNMSQEPDSVAKYGIDIVEAVALISNTRSALSGGTTTAAGTTVAGAVSDQGIVLNNSSNIVPSDVNGVALERNTREVLNIVYGAMNSTSGGFFPSGMNGIITS